VFWALAGLYLVYAFSYIMETVVPMGDASFPTLFDDAFVSMRYAENLAEGHGLVWNPGEAPVEGYTNLLWTLYMALLHLLGLGTNQIILGVQLTSALCLALSLVFVGRIVLLQTKGALWAAMGAMICTGLYLPLNTFSLQGMEPGLLALILTMGTWYALAALNEDRFCIAPYIFMGIALLIRPDAIVAGLVMVGYLVITDAERRKRHLLYGTLTLVGVSLALIGFRLAYYGEHLPNTYYLKLTGYPLLLRLSRGAHVGFQFLSNTYFLFILLPIGWGLVSRRLGFRLISLLFLAQLAYSIWVGGDAWEEGGANRYLCVVMPLFFSLYWATLWEALHKVQKPSFVALKTSWKGGVLVFLFGLLSVLNFNAYAGSKSLNELLLRRAPLLHNFHQENLELATVVRGLTTPQARVLVVWAGAIPYLSKRPSLDMLGKCDTVIARSEAHLPDEEFRSTGFWPGHNKWDYAYSIGQLQPDLITRLWMIPSGAQAFLKNYQAVQLGKNKIYVRSGSPHIHWDRIRKPDA